MPKIWKTDKKEKEFSLADDVLDSMPEKIARKADKLNSITTASDVALGWLHALVELEGKGTISYDASEELRSLSADLTSYYAAKRKAKNEAA